MTFTEAVEEIAKVTNLKVQYRQISPEVFADAMAEQSVPSDAIWLMNYLFTTVLDGRNAHLSDGVKRALGREPRDFSDYVQKAAANGAWQEGNINHD